MTDSREEFEAYWKDRCAKQRPYSTVNLKTVAEESWQASRAALKVELPYPICVDEGGEFAHSAYDKDDTDKALQQAGIEVK